MFLEVTVSKIIAFICGFARGELEILKSCVGDYIFFLHAVSHTLQGRPRESTFLRNVWSRDASRIWRKVGNGSVLI